MNLSSSIYLHLLYLAILLAIAPAFADSQKDRDAATALAIANSQHARDVAIIDKLLKENAVATAAATKSSNSNGVAIAKLGNESKERAAIAVVRGDAAQHTALVVQDAIVSTKITTDAIKENTDQVVAKVNSIEPLDYRPIWLSAIAAIVAMFGGVTSIVLAMITRNGLQQQGATLNKVHALTNSAMTAALEGTATARSANAASLKTVYLTAPNEVNKQNLITAERMAEESQHKFEIHQQTQDKLNCNDLVAEEKAKS